MSCVVNEVTGEVSVTVAGIAFTLHATMPKVAALQTAINVPGLRMMNMMLAANDSRMAYEGMKNLCTSGNADELETMLFPPVMGDVMEAVAAALTAGLPEADDADDGDDGDNGGKPEATTSLGEE